MRYLLVALCLSCCLASSYAWSFPGPETDGTAQNCVEAADGAGGPKCESLKVGVCCDAFQKQGNCLTASGSSCASYGPAGETPLTAYCCDQLDIPACKPVSKASDCKSVDVQEYGMSNEYLVCCAKTKPSDVNVSGEEMMDGLDCHNATNAARLETCTGLAPTRPKLLCCA